MLSTQPVIRVSDEELAELRDRVRTTRWPGRWPLSGWDAGTNMDELRRFAQYWTNGFDWRTQEAEINALPSHFETVAGSGVRSRRGSLR